MERYLEVTTVQEASRADRSCEVLERAGIPVLIRHVEIVSGDFSSPGYTLLVPSQHSNQALRLVTEGSSGIHAMPHEQIS